MGSCTQVWSGSHLAISEHSPIPELLVHCLYISGNTQSAPMKELILVVNTFNTKAGTIIIHHHCQHHHQYHHQRTHHNYVPMPDTGRKKLCSVNEDDPKAGGDCVLCNIDQAILGSLVLHNQLLQLSWQIWMRFYRNMKRKHDTRNWEKYNLRNIKTSMKADTMSTTLLKVRVRENITRKYGTRNIEKYKMIIL